MSKSSPLSLIPVSLVRLSFWRKLHKYLGWLLLLQLLCWFGSGLVMSLLPISEVRGEHLRKTLTLPDWTRAISPSLFGPTTPRTSTNTKPTRFNTCLSIQHRAAATVLFSSDSRSFAAFNPSSGKNIGAAAVSG